MQIDIEQLTIAQAREIQNLLLQRFPLHAELKTAKLKSQSVDVNIGKQIVVLDRGFVYVGDVQLKGDYVHLNNAKNIRRWGTSKGLGELLDGPLANTVTDPVGGTILIPARAVIHFIAVKKGW